MIEMGPGVYMEYVGSPRLAGDPEIGAVYLCEKVNDCPPGYSCGSCGKNSGKGLELQGLPTNSASLGWCANHWRPIHKRDESLIQSLLAPIKEKALKELEPA